MSNDDKIVNMGSIGAGTTEQIWSDLLHSHNEAPDWILDGIAKQDI